MQKFALSQIFKRSPHSHILPTRLQSQAGFTLLELLVVVGLISVLAAISAPGWLGFIQQRRVTGANDAVVRALQEAQNKAKTQKVSYSVSFNYDGGIPKVAVYQGSTTPALTSNYWKQLGEQLSLKPGQVLIGTNITGENASGGDISYGNIPTDAKITFEYTGGLPTTPTPNLGTNDRGLIMVVAAPQGNSNTPIPSTIRCVKVYTILGSIQAGKIDSTGQCSPIR